MSSRWEWWRDGKHEPRTSVSKTLGSSAASSQCPGSSEGQVRDVFTLSSTMAWTSKKDCRHPSPFHNYLLISCFVSAVVARANAMNTTALKREPCVRQVRQARLLPCPSSLFTGEMVCATWESISRQQKEGHLKIGFMFCFSHPHGKSECSIST